MMRVLVNTILIMAILALAISVKAGEPHYFSHGEFVKDSDGKFIIGSDGKKIMAFTFDEYKKILKVDASFFSAQKQIEKLEENIEIQKLTIMTSKEENESIQREVSLISARYLDCSQELSRYKAKYEWMKWLATVALTSSIVAGAYLYLDES